MSKYIETMQHEFVERDKWGKDQEDILDELLKEQGIIKYAIVHASFEGGRLPTKLETSSWSILLPDERILGFTLDWDPKRIAPDGSKGYYKLKGPTGGKRAEDESGEITYFTPKGPVEVIEPGWRLKDPYYIRARKELGLPLTEEQEKILEE